VTSIAVWVALACILGTAWACPVVVAFTESFVVSVCVRGTLGTVLMTWSVAHIRFAEIAEAVTVSDVIGATFTIPVFMAYAVSVVVEVGVLDAGIAIAGTWAEASVTFVVTEALEDVTLVTSPVVVAYAGPATCACVNFELSVVYTVFAIT